MTCTLVEDRHEPKHPVTGVEGLASNGSYRISIHRAIKLTTGITGDWGREAGK